MNKSEYIISTEYELFYEFIQGILDQKNFFMLKATNTSRSELFNFALALGLDEDKTPLKRKNDLTRENYMNGFKYMYHSLLPNYNEEIDEASSFMSAEEYANTGFYKLKELIESGYTEEDLLNLLSPEITGKEAEIKSFIDSL